MPMMSRRGHMGFCIAPFGIDGASIYRGFWGYAKLSPEWLAVCRKHIQECGSVSDMPLHGKLSHIRIKFTSASGAALVTIPVRRRTVSSFLLLTRQSPAADMQIAKT